VNPLLPALPGPLFLFVAMVLVALCAYVTHRWSIVSGLIAAAGCLALTWLCLQQFLGHPVVLLGRTVLLGNSLVVLGREWTLTSSGLAALTFILGAAGLVYLLGLPASQGWSFHASGVLVIAVLSLSIMAQQYVFAILFLWLAATLAAFVFAGGRPGASVGALRFMVLTAVAAMILLVMPAFLDPAAVSKTAAAFAMPPGPAVSAGSTDMSSGALPTASILTVIGFGILLMMVPFHGQLLAIAASSAPMVLAFALSAFPPVVFHILFRLGQTYPALFEDQLLVDVCRWAGIGVVAFGGLGAMGQRRLGSLLGYAALVDWGAGLIALGEGMPQGAERATQMVVWRVLSLMLAGAGWTSLYRLARQRDDLDRCRGMLHRRPLSVVLLFLGLLSLAAFPLTPGAAGRWPLISQLMDSQPGTAWVLILSGVGVCVGAVMGLRACLSAAPGENREQVVPMAGDTAFALLTLWIVGYLFLRPTLWLDMARQFLAGFSWLAG
jgi:formate hydrogenlyase subunit 3/multisubunit Na+/H+ antiporter MnhD subunit